MALRNYFELSLNEIFESIAMAVNQSCGEKLAQRLKREAAQVRISVSIFIAFESEKNLT